MNRLRIITAIFKRQRLDIYRNKKILLMFIIFPAMTLLYQLVGSEIGSNSGILFLEMNMIMPPITCMAGTISEEYEKGTLRGMFFSGVKPMEYITGIGLCIGIFTFISSCIIAIILNVGDDNSFIFFLFVISGIIVSLLIGAIIGLLAKSQVNVAPLTAPVSLILGILPSIAAMNKSLYSVMQFFYSQVTMNILQRKVDYNRYAIMIALNIVILGVVFYGVFKKRCQDN